MGGLPAVWAHDLIGTQIFICGHGSDKAASRLEHAQHFTQSGAQLFACQVFDDFGHHDNLEMSVREWHGLRVTNLCPIAQPQTSPKILNGFFARVEAAYNCALL